MKKIMVLTLVTFGIMFGAAANGNMVLVEKRADHLSEQMIRGLRLNNYQAKKIRAINLDKTAKMLAIEQAYAGKQQMIDRKCKEVCAERDLELEHVLSTVQYNIYFGDRKIYNKADQEFMAALSQQDSRTAAGVLAVTAPDIR